MTELSCKCGNVVRAEGQRYCRSCHNAYMRFWRKTHKLTGEARKKDIARHVAGVYFRRGALNPEPCEVCGKPSDQKHHDDYSKPLMVRWFCRDHHMQLHGIGPLKYINN